MKKPTKNIPPHPGRSFGLAIAVAAIAAFANANAAVVTATWSSATSGAWNVNANWTNAPALGGFPDNGNGGVATYDAVIDATGPAYTVTLSTTDTVEKLTLNSANATLAITAGTFTANTGVDLTAGSLLLNGGTIANTIINATPGALNIAANTSNLLSGVTVNGNLNLSAESAAVKIAGGSTFTTARLASRKTTLGFAPGHTLNGTVIFESGPLTGDPRTVGMDGTAGIFTIGTAGVIRTSGTGAGDGQVGAAGSGYGGAMTLVNQGLISSQVNATVVTINPANFANTGTVEARNGGTLTIAPTNTWNNAGTIAVGSVGTVNLQGTFDATGGIGTWNNAGGTVNLRGTLLNTGHALTFDGTTGSWTLLQGGTISGGTIGFVGGQSLRVAGGSANLLTGVKVNGDLNVAQFGAVRIAGGSTFTTARLAGSSSNVGFAPGQTLNSTVVFEGPTFSGPLRTVSMDGNAGTFTIGPTGVIRTNPGLAGNAQIGAGGANYGGAMTLINQGLISSQAASRAITINPASFTNTGTVEARNGGLLSIAPTSPWTNNGTIAVGGGSTVYLGGTFDVTGGIGTFSNTGGEVFITGTLLNTGRNLILDSATGSWALQDGTISGGTIGSVGGQSLSTTSGSTFNTLTGVRINGDLDLTAVNSGVRIAGSTTFTTAHLASAFTNLGFAPGRTLNGTILFEGPDGGNQRIVGMNGNAGTFTIGPNGVIRTSAGLGGDAQIGTSVAGYGGAMTLTNRGLISSQVAARFITINPASFMSTGTIQAINGGLLYVPNGYTQTAGTTRVASGSTISVDAGQTITIDAGRLEGGGTIAANVSNAGTIAPGSSAGALTIAGDLTLIPASVLQIELGGVTPGTQHDRLTEAGTVTFALAGTLDVTFINGFQNTVQPTDAFTILTSNQTITGTFSNVTGGRVVTTDGFGSFAVNLNAGGNNVVLGSYVPVPEPSTAALLALGSLLIGTRRRRR